MNEFTNGFTGYIKHLNLEYPTGCIIAKVRIRKQQNNFKEFSLSAFKFTKRN